MTPQQLAYLQVTSIVMSIVIFGLAVYFLSESFSSVKGLAHKRFCLVFGIISVIIYIGHKVFLYYLFGK